MLNKKSFHTTYLIIFLIILFVFTFPLIFKIDKAVYGPLYKTDNRGALWHFWWFSYAYKNGLSLDKNTLVNYPFGAKYMVARIYPLSTVLAYIFSVIFNEIFAYNTLILMSFILSFSFMYVLVFYLTKRRASAFISGIIYSLCPYHINKSWEHLGLLFIEFIPFYIYCLLRLKDEPSLKNIFFCSLALALVILSDLTYCYIIFVFSVLYILFSIYYYFKNKISFQAFITFFINFIKMGLLSIFIASPLLMPVLKGIISPSSEFVSEGARTLVRPFHYLFTQSASILAYLIPSKYHPLWGGLGRSLEGTIFFGRGSIEQTLYLGWIGLFLSYIAIKKERHSKTDNINTIVFSQEKFVKNLFLFIFISSIIFSMPPYWNLLFFKVYFPSFFLYKFIPAFRAYARFGVLTILSVSILAGYGFSFLISTKKRKKILLGMFSTLILIDFANIPPLRVTEIDKCPKVYEWFREQKNNFVIAEYPMKLGDTAEGYINLDYLLYQRFHKIPMINGVEPDIAPIYAIKRRIVKITNMDTPGILKSLGVKYVIIHLKEYRQTTDIETVDIVGEVPDLSKSKGLKLVKKFDDDEVYEVIARPIDLEYQRDNDKFQ